MILLVAVMLAQALSFPQLAPGSEVRLVSSDLLTVHAVGRVEDGVLALEGEVEPGAGLRMLVFPPDADPDAGGAADGAAGVWSVRVDPAGDDLWLSAPDLAEPISLRTWLPRERGVELRMPAGSGGD